MQALTLDSLGSLRRSHGCGEVDLGLLGSEVTLAGWVHRRRDHGGVIFVDLRDRTGLVQVVFEPDYSGDSHRRAHHLRSEYVIAVRGEVRRRSEETVNPALATGELEVFVHELRILNTATPPPFPIEEETGVDESVRLRHRVHDLRRPPLQRALEIRHRLYQSVRRTLSELGFTEIETPYLARSTPEGARDFLVPSRLQPGCFYALPQSPQLMKQLLMAAGFERYFQIVRCFRDEDLRADRQPEFTQIDLEMSFVGVEDVLEVLEEVTARGCLEAAGVELPRPFPRLSYAEVMDRYGTDKPDRRIPLELADLTGIFRESGFRAFRQVVETGGIVKCLPVPDAEELSRGEIDRLERFVRKELGGRGLAWIRVTADGGWQSPIVKFLSEEDGARIVAIVERDGAIVNEAGLPVEAVRQQRVLGSHDRGLHLAVGEVVQHREQVFGVVADQLLGDACELALHVSFLTGGPAGGQAELESMEPGEVDEPGIQGTHLERVERAQEFVGELGAPLPGRRGVGLGVEVFEDPRQLFLVLRRPQQAREHASEDLSGCLAGEGRRQDLARFHSGEEQRQVRMGQLEGLPRPGVGDEDALWETGHDSSPPSSSAPSSSATASRPRPRKAAVRGRPRKSPVPITSKRRRRMARTVSAICSSPRSQGTSRGFCLDTNTSSTRRSPVESRSGARWNQPKPTSASPSTASWPRARWR